MVVHARRRLPGIVWCGLREDMVRATPWAHEVTCGECIELICEDMPERVVFFIEPLDLSPELPWPAPTTDTAGAGHGRQGAIPGL